MKAVRNIAGVDVCTVDGLNVELLAPGGQPGRLLITTKKAINLIGSKYGD